MGCDLVVALGPATAEGHTLFGLNSHRSLQECQSLQLVPGRDFAPGEKVRTQFLELPQARASYTVLGSQPEGRWGYHHGLNEHHLAAGCALLRTKLRGRGPGLLGTDLVRLVLERCRAARAAVELLTDLIERHGQGLFPGCPEALAEGDHAFLVADPTEAFVVEAAGHGWVSQEIRRVRAVSDVCLVRQDWNRIAPGLADHAIDQGWWPGDGSKLDFAGALSASAAGQASALRRWGRATLLLEEHAGKIDATFLRRLLADHYEGTPDEVDPLYPAHGPYSLCRHASLPFGSATVAGLIAALPGDPARLPLAWCVFGTPCSGVYLPVFLDGELPAAFARGGARPTGESLWWRVQQLGLRAAGDRALRGRVCGAMAALQAHFDREAANFAAEGAALKRGGDRAELRRQAGFFMQHVLEQLEKALDQLEPRTSAPLLVRETAGRV